MRPPYRLILSWFLFLPQMSWAWGSLGHQTVAIIASHHLTPAAKEQVEKILGDETLSVAALWPDTVKKTDEWKFTGPYHYMNHDKGRTFWETPLSSKGDALRALVMYSEVLTSSTTLDEEKLTALRMISHLIGDLHQPLHMGEGENWGGNKIFLQFAPDFMTEPTDKVENTNVTYKPNLHSLWDEDIPKHDYLEFCKIKGWPLNPAIYATSLEEEFSKVKVNNSLDLSVWILEDSQLNKDVVMKFKYSKDKNDTALITKKYMDKGAKVASLRIYLAGLRLARTLNLLLDQHSVPRGYMTFKQKVTQTFGPASFDFFRLHPQK